MESPDLRMGVEETGHRSVMRSNGRRRKRSPGTQAFMPDAAVLSSAQGIKCRVGKVLQMLARLNDVVERVEWHSPLPAERQAPPDRGFHPACCVNRFRESHEPKAVLTVF